MKRNHRWECFSWGKRLWPQIDSRPRNKIFCK